MNKIKNWSCPDCKASSYKEVTINTGKKFNPIHGANFIDIILSTGLYVCCGCSRIFGNPLKYNGNKE